MSARAKAIRAEEMNREGLRDSIRWLARRKFYWLQEARTHAETLRRGRLNPMLRENQRKCLKDAVAFARLMNRRLMVARRELRRLGELGHVA